MFNIKKMILEKKNTINKALKYNFKSKEKR